MANRLLKILLPLALLALLTWLGFWFSENYAWRSKEIRGGFSLEARRNPLLAAERFLQRLGRHSSSVSGRGVLHAPPQDQGLLLVRDLGPSLPPLREEALLEWVADGNELIFSLSHIPAADSNTNSLLRRLGVRLIEIEKPQNELDKPKDDVVKVTDEIETLHLDLEKKRLLVLDEEREAGWSIGTDEGYYLLGFEWGKGAITVMSDLRFLENTRIDAHDHALFLSELVGESQHIWLVYDTQMPSLWNLIWQRAPYPVMIAGLLLLAALWRLGERSGPILQIGDNSRRDLLEHLQAAAEFVWHRGRGLALQRNCRKEVEQRWLGKHPALSRLTPYARSEWLAGKTGMPARLIFNSLYTDQIDERGLILASKVLQRLSRRQVSEQSEGNGADTHDKFEMNRSLDERI